MRCIASVVLACTLSLPSLAMAQDRPMTTSATSVPGPLAVVGIRTPDGDVDVAGMLTAALREAARARGYEVPNDTPSFDQEFAMLGCATISPDCLSLIAADIHAQKYLYGTLLRVGRGRNASMSIEVSLWDNFTRREVHREAATFTRAQATTSPEFVRSLAQRIVDALAARDAAAEEERLRLRQAEAALRARENTTQDSSTPATSQAPTPQNTTPSTAVVPRSNDVHTPSTSPPERSHLLRWVGVGLLGAGVVAGSIAAWQWVRTSNYSSESQNARCEEGNAWACFDNRINPPDMAGVRMLSVSEVCDRARADTANTDARGAAQLCDAHSQARWMAIAFGVGGLLLAGVGTTLVILDGTRSGAHDERPHPPAQARLQVTPVLAPGIGAVHVGVTF
jgi:hypothetical protein